MRLQSAELLRALVGPEASKKMSARRLADYVDCSHTFINHLLTGRRRSCTPKLAERICEVLGVPIDLLFLTVVPADSRRAGAQRKPRNANGGRNAA